MVYSLHVLCGPINQAMGGLVSPEALVGRLYAGRGLRDRLTAKSPPRNFFFDINPLSPARHPIGDEDVDGNMLSAIAGAPSLRHFGGSQDRESPVKDASPVSPGIQPEAVMLKPLQARDTALSTSSQAQRLSLVNSPPHIGLRRRSSGHTRSTSSLPATHLERSTPGSGKSGYSRPRVGQAAGLFPIGGGMLLSRSQGALGQGASGRSTHAVVNTRDDGAPYLRSEKMSPKSSRPQDSPRYAVTADLSELMKIVCHVKVRITVQLRVIVP